MNAAEGGLHIENPDPETRARHRRALDRAKRDGLVPAGKSLRHTGRSSEDLIIQLIDPANGGETEWNRIRGSAGTTCTGTAAIVDELRRDPSMVQVPEQMLPRAIAVVKAVGTAVSKSGYRLVLTRKPRNTGLFVTVDGHQYDLTVTEDQERVGEPTPSGFRRSGDRYRRHPPEYEHRWTGRLRLGVPPETYAEYADWSDKGRRRLENQVRALVPELRHRSQAAHEEKRARERRLREWEEEQERRDREKRAAWEKAMAEARSRAVVAKRNALFRDAVESWTTVGGIRRFCRELEEEAGGCADPEHAERLRQWAQWGEETARSWDPGRSDSGLRSQSFDAAPTPDEPRPFVGDWSPHGPYREYRYRPLPKESPSEATGGTSSIGEFRRGGAVDRSRSAGSGMSSPARVGGWRRCPARVPRHLRRARLRLTLPSQTRRR
ncbi:hypothetical protein HNR06_002802 [Nocardiopsis arvandica]|uniref:PE-PGRS family protein n=1 Tax=Nocardiopsis sinuspersici TaxID=501010 RepID=A0A7Y9XCJ6_9ACTN|nr:hypothetical protein [Nocardiopsis sinuspersici]NYH53213.1 hypothetical protein [Nocardiopsis sinuspersici]